MTFLASPPVFSQTNPTQTGFTSSAAIAPTTTLPAGAGPGGQTGGSIAPSAPATFTSTTAISTASSAVGTPAASSAQILFPTAGTTVPGMPPANDESGFGAGAGVPVPATTATATAMTATATPTAVPAAGSAPAPVAAEASVRPVAVGESISVAGTSVSPPNLVVSPVVVTPAVGSSTGGGSASGAPGATLQLDPLDTLF